MSQIIKLELRIIALSTSTKQERAIFNKNIINFKNVVKVNTSFDLGNPMTIWLEFSQKETETINMRIEQVKDFAASCTCSLAE